MSADALAPEVRHHFAVPVWTTGVEGFAEHRGALLETILTASRTSPGIVLSNERGWHSPVDLQQSDHPEWRWLTGALLASARTTLSRSPGAGPDFQLVVASMWANVAPAGAWHRPHHHFPMPYSGVLYVAAGHAVPDPSGAGRTGKLEFLSPLSVGPAFASEAGVLYTPRDGLVVLFPGSLVHFTYPHDAKDPRVTVSFNLAWVRKG